MTWWRELTINNDQSPTSNNRRIDKAFLLRFESEQLTIQITARHHDGCFKWYLDCPCAKIHEQQLGIVGEMSTVGAKMVAIDTIWKVIEPIDPYSEHLSKLYKLRVVTVNDYHRANGK